MVEFRSSPKFDKSAAVILIEKTSSGIGRPRLSNAKLEKEISLLATSGKFSADQGELFPLVFNGRTVILTGVGKKDECSLTALRTTLRKALLSSWLSKLENVEIIPHTKDDETIIAVIEAALIGTYAWKKYLTKDTDSKALDNKKFWIAAPAKSAFQDAVKTCAGVALTRDLINDNADTVDSDFLEKTIRGLIAGHKKISVEVLNQKNMKAKGLNLHLAVNQGSRKEPKLIIVKYNGASSKGNYTAVLGKGITFDTGGLNLKPTGSMETMRTDMSGAAAVIGILKSTLALDLKKNVLFAVTIAENVIGSGAYKPGDVFRGYSGKTVEIANTDAEGRLVLADALAYLVKNYHPDRIIDMATLTGACVVALGHDYSGLMANDEKLADAIKKSAAATDDRVWQLPLYAELKDHIKSQVADIKNTGLRGAAGTISAAEFLRQFVGETAWAHLDIAGTAFVQEQGRFYFGHGATGAGVRLLTHFLTHH